MARMGGLRQGVSRIALLMLLAVSLAACSTVKGWTGKDEDEEKTPPRLPGERLTVMSSQSDIAIDPALEKVDFRAVKVLENQSWPQRGANPSNALGAVKVSGLKPKDSARIGSGEEWGTVLVTAPVVADGVVYAMDAKGYISAHRTENIDKVLWVSDVPVVDEDEDILGGGLAVAGGQLFVSTGQGDVFAINAQDGSRIWKRGVGSPMRSAPKLQQGMIYVTTVDDQLFALDSANGAILWQHRGLGERVGFLSAVSPAIGENIVVVTYASGEIYGLAADTGQELWNDSLAMTVKTSATSVFTGFDGDAVIAGGVAFASSNNGLSAATHLLSGRRLWEQEISAADTPWLAGNYLFLLTSDAQVAAVYARDGRVKWVHKLDRYEDPERQRKPYRWFGPMMLGEQLAVFGGHGEMVLISPQDGMVTGTLDTPEGLRTAPIVADGAVYMITQDATLHVLR